ncbi:metal ABC transporter substrate-binding protein [Tropicimonas sp. TH_r6]|uniref:metal ABC transporter substrate-binding protein n=1 Tax=Tropicimonas sp. TH_r6 TaxID=3082085 RepID=UPI002955108B|nr:metal ABC transporter substrate-binding protein [Tropicimonas sp. TH_r6]MDV7144289.1 metal ABC transporter substrate-binding protein [Tropicimonas sp. TH_r6]
MRLYRAILATLTLAAPPALADTSRTIAAVNAPLAYIASVLGGAQVDVIYPLPPDVDPAYWSPSPEEVQAYQQADLILLNGAGYAGWVESALLPRARLVDTTAAVQALLIPAETETVAHKHGPEGEHAHDGAYAFTTWLDPQIAEAQIAAAAGAISARWPDMAPQIEQRTADLRAEIAAMDAALSRFFSKVSERQIFASHPIYQYLDYAYPGDITALHWEPDTDPGEQEWSAFELAIDADRHPIMLWEDFATAGTQQRLEGLGVEIIVLNPMANAETWDGLFLRLADQVAGK